jgi:hypothetical protein
LTHLLQKAFLSILKKQKMFFLLQTLTGDVMKFAILVFITLTLSSLLYSTTFVDVNAGLPQLNDSSVAWGDYDNDGDLDILICGFTTAEERITRIYRNNGNGTFTDINAGLAGLSSGDAAWGDFDQDSDLDIVITGVYAENDFRTLIYRNNGDDTFTITSSWAGVSQASVAWGDLDNDGDLDVICTGYDGMESVTKIYSNENGWGMFRDANTTLPGISGGSIVLGDCDNDGDLDILLNGTTNSSDKLNSIYHNEGNWNFTDINANLPGLSYGSLDWGDYDNDGDLDIVMSGDSMMVSIFRVYSNDGNNTFTDINAGLPGSFAGSTTWGDYDNDGKLDILVTGFAGGTPITKIYRNNGSNTFTDINTGLEGICLSSAGWGDYDNDGDLDILYTGATPSGVTKLYRNDNTPSNTIPSSPSNLTATHVGDFVIFEWDAATDSQTPSLGLNYNLRIGTTADSCQILSPMSANSGYRLIPAKGTANANCRWKIARANLPNTFYWGVQTIDGAFAGSAFTNTVTTLSNVYTEFKVGLPGVIFGSTSWGDYDRDGYIDVLMTGRPFPFGLMPGLYHNNGDSTFTEINAGLPAISESCAAWGDYDNDGDLDIALSGDTGLALISKIYRNNGNGTFTDMNVALQPVSQGNLAWGDYNNDGYLDLLLTGCNGSGYYAIIYRNNGNGTFTNINAGLAVFANGSVAWGDYDNDGDLDIILTGNGLEMTKIYRNDGGNAFTDINAPLPLAMGGAVAWGDYDNDGDLDILLSGFSFEGAISKIFRNNGNGTFTDINAGLPGVFYSTATWGDCDNDGDLDIFLSGSTGTNNVTKIYRNNGNHTFSDINAGLVGTIYSSSAWVDYNNDGFLDILHMGFTGSKMICNIYTVNSSNPNTSPSVPTGLSASRVGDYIHFTWNASTDNQTPSPGLSYVLRIGSTPGGCQVFSPMASSSGQRYIPVNGYVNSTCSWKILSAELPDTFYWSVQAIDNAYAGSAFATEQSFTLPPKLILLSSQPVLFENTQIGSYGGWSGIRVQNNDTRNYTINTVRFSPNSGQFIFNYPKLGIPMLPGQIDTIFVRFSPITTGTKIDSLYLESNAPHSTTLKIRLSGLGTAIAAPLSPENLTIVNVGYNMQLNWDAVTRDINGSIAFPDGYLVFYSAASINNDDDYYYLWESSNTSFTHYRVARFSPRMMYRVFAYKDISKSNIERLRMLNGTTQKLRLRDLMLE